MSAGPIRVHRSGPVLRADPSRVISRIFLPGQETLARGISRADAVMERILGLTDDQVEATLGWTTSHYGARHHDLGAVFAEHFAHVEHRLPAGAQPSQARRDLIGAFFTHEYAIEAAAFFNPSMVAHPDQAGAGPGELRFVMSARAVGEGHISSIEFRTGAIGSDGEVTVDPAGDHLVTGRARPVRMSRERLRESLSERSEASDVDYVLSLLPARFEPADLETALASVQRDRLTRASSDDVVERIRWIVACNYQLEFPADRPLAERVVHPSGPDETHGIEDARLTRFVDDDGAVTYYGTYTGFDGVNVSSHLLHTGDFRHFEMSRLVGPAARDKGMALFPRRVGGSFATLSRSDRETIGVAISSDVRTWCSSVTVQAPRRPWEAIQLGNCGPPIETPSGWLVLTHGVGPMRSYAMGAILLDLDDPTRLLGVLGEPFLTPADDERDGYVPNVVYSCGAIVHGDHLVVPYGCSDSTIRFARVDLPEMLAALAHPDSRPGP